MPLPESRTTKGETRPSHQIINTTSIPKRCIKQLSQFSHCCWRHEEHRKLASANTDCKLRSIHFLQKHSPKPKDKAFPKKKGKTPYGWDVGVHSSDTCSVPAWWEVSGTFQYLCKSCTKDRLRSWFPSAYGLRSEKSSI